MPSTPAPRVDLRSLILLLAILTAFITLVNSLYASYEMQRQLLIESTLEANRVYAAKLAASTERFLASVQQSLAYSASQLAEGFDDHERAFSETEHLQRANDTFNSVAVSNAEGIVSASSPASLHLEGIKLDTAGAREALAQRRPITSQPYISAVGNLVIFMSHPIVDSAGRYQGYIGGTIYLKRKNILNELLGESYYRDGSYLYVVDSGRHLLFHPDNAGLGEPIVGNPVIENVIAGGSSSMPVRNSRGVDMLAGYAPVPSVGWGIVAQRPTSLALAPLQDLMLSHLRNILPVGLLTLILVWWLARLIAQPLRELADGAGKMTELTTEIQIRSVRSWYSEAALIKQALLMGVSLFHKRISMLKQEVHTDPLTGLLNRRAVNFTLEEWEKTQAPFSAIALDIDHFKQINDTFGHDVGDVVLQQLSELMIACSRVGDLICRVGGEEFLMLLPGASLEVAGRVAERLRTQVERAPMDVAMPITVSLGVAHWPRNASRIKEVLKIADEMMYQAKQGGRNCIVVAPVIQSGAATAP